jgi:hypothetical protein
MVSSIGRKVMVSRNNTWVPGTIVDGFQDDPEQGFLYDIRLDQPQDHVTLVTGRPSRIGLRQANFYFVDQEA